VAVRLALTMAQILYLVQYPQQVVGLEATAVQAEALVVLVAVVVD
jgi:hypothetical protein